MTPRPSPEARDAANSAYSRAVSEAAADPHVDLSYLVVWWAVHERAHKLAQAAIARVDRHRERET